jgi:hypothetical protein
MIGEQILNSITGVLGTKETVDPLKNTTKTDNTMIYIALGVGGVMMLLVLYFVLSKK